MKNYDVYIIAPIMTKSNNVYNISKNEDDMAALNYNISKLMRLYKAKVDTYNFIDSKINYVDEGREHIDASSCVIIVAPSDSNNMREFMQLISYAISKNKKLYVLILNNKTQMIQTGIIANGYEDVTVDIDRNEMKSYKKYERFVLSAIKESKMLYGKTS